MIQKKATPARKKKQDQDADSNEKTTLSFELSLSELEKIVIRLESGELLLEEALNEFERGMQLSRLSQQTLKQAEQRVHILLNDEPDAPLVNFTPDTR